MVRFFVFFLRKYFDLRDEEIKLTCNLFADHVQRQREIERFWLDPRVSTGRPGWNRNTWPKRPKRTGTTES